MSRGKSDSLALAGNPDDAFLGSATAAASAAGYLFSQANHLELAHLMRSIERGDASTASRIAHRIVRLAPGAAAAHVPLANAPQTQGAAPAGKLLTPRELEVLRLIAQGWSSRQIAEAIPRSIHTIETQVKSIYRKLAVSSRTQAVREATRRGLLDWDADGGTPQA